MWAGKGGRLSQCTALTWRNLWAKHQSLIGIWHFHGLSTHKVVAPPLIFPYGLYQINLVPQICIPGMSDVQKENCLNCLCLWWCIDHCVVTKAQPNLYFGSPSQKFWYCSCIDVETELCPAHLWNLQYIATESSLWNINTENKDRHFWNSDMDDMKCISLFCNANKNRAESVHPDTGCLLSKILILLRKDTFELKDICLYLCNF